MLEPLADTFAEHATRLQRIAAIAATAFALGGAGDASAEVIFDNSTGTSSSGGYVVGEYSPGSVYALEAISPCRSAPPFISSAARSAFRSPRPAPD
jgi:hypothetical protein